MEVQIKNREEAIRYSYKPHDEECCVISISTPWAAYPERIYPSPQNRIKSALYLVFDDVESGTNCMTDVHADAIREFVERHKDSKFIVHCDAGVSRSAGVAAALMKYYNGDDMPVFDNAKYCPNMLCYRLTLNALMNQKGREN